MSYEAWGEPEDDYMTPEQAGEMGWLDPGAVEALQRFAKHLEMAEDFPRPGNKSDAAIVLIDHMLNPPDARLPEDPAVTWAKRLLDDRPS